MTTTLAFGDFAVINQTPKKQRPRASAAWAGGWGTRICADRPWSAPLRGQLRRDAARCPLSAVLPKASNKSDLPSPPANTPRAPNGARGVLAGGLGFSCRRSKPLITLAFLSTNGFWSVPKSVQGKLTNLAAYV